MNANERFSDMPREDPEIVLISIKRETYYIVEGEEHLSELMMVDGNFPSPIRCMNFESRFALHSFAGEDVKLSDFWAINPKIVDRLRQENKLIED